MLHRMHEAKSLRGSLNARLEALSPLAVLGRGYALVRDEQGRVVRDAATLASGEVVSTRLARGQFTSRVGEIPVESDKSNSAKERRKR